MRETFLFLVSNGLFDLFSVFFLLLNYDFKIEKENFDLHEVSPVGPQQRILLSDDHVGVRAGEIRQELHAKIVIRQVLRLKSEIFEC